MRRLFLLCAAAVLATGVAGPAPALAAEPSETCTTAADAVYTVDLDDAAGTATLSSDKPFCAGEGANFSLVSYTAPAAAVSYPRRYYDAVTYQWIRDSVPSVSMKVDVPGCFHQLAVIRGSRPLPAVPDAATDNLVVGEVYGGTTACTPAPAVEFVSSCDGNLVARLTNAASADVDAVFQISQLKYGPAASRVAPGKTVTAPLPQRLSYFDITDNTGRRHQATWERPATCSSPSTTVSPAPAGSVATSRAAPAAATADDGGQGGGLPVTGSNVPAVAGVAGGLVVIGVLLLLLARRSRRSRFTA